MSDCIFTPIYRGNKYLYHECSECNYHVRMDEGVLTPLYFGDSFNYCPNCASPVVRFATLPKFLEEFEYAIFKDIEKIYERYIDELTYYLHIKLDKEELQEIKERSKFAIELEKNGGRKVSPAVVDAARICSKKFSSHWERSKLIERMEKNCKTN